MISHPLSFFNYEYLFIIPLEKVAVKLITATVARLN